MIWLTVFIASALLHLFTELRKTWIVGKWRPSNQNEKIHSFSVVICAKNEFENLKKLIPRILAQQYPDFEVILILDRCTDKSLAFAKSIADPRFYFIEISEVPKGWNPKKFGLTAGIEKAGNEWILLTDGDCQVLSTNWISGYNQLITEKIEIILGLSPYQNSDGLLSGFIQYETFQTGLSYTASALSGKPYMGVGRNLAYRKSTFLKNNGFELIKGVNGGDDDLLVQMISTGRNIIVNANSESLTHSESKNTWSDYFHQKTRHLSAGRYYRKEFSTMLTYRSVVHFVLWLSFLILVATNRDWPIVFSVFGCLLLIKGLIYHRIFNIISMKFNLILLPIMDFGYAVILPAIGIRSFFVKNYVWKKN